MALTWNGDAVIAKTERAVVAAMEETMAECVLEAKHLVPVRTATLQGSIQFKPVERDGKGFVGRWGSFDVNYAVYVELGFQGTVRVGSHVRKITQVYGRPLRFPLFVNVAAHTRQVDTQGTPYLRPSADREYPKLAKRIKRRMAA